MADDSGINKTQVWVTVITVVGGLLTAIIVNADKWFGEPKVATPPSAEVSAKPSQAPPTPPVVAVDISGEWRADDGSRFGVTQSGSSYEYTHTAINGTFQSAGKGTISGRELSHTFEMVTGETGTCTGYVNAAANKITGSCVTQGGAWTYVIER